MGAIVNEFKLLKKVLHVSWKAYAIQDGFSTLELEHEEKTVHDARLIVTESFTHVSGRTSVKEVWHFLTPEDLDALAAAAAIMAKDIRSARARMAEVA